MDDKVSPRALDILVVEDDKDIARLVCLHLEDLNANTTHIDNGRKALAAAIDGQWDLIILDLRLPEMSGLDICRKLRESGNQTPVLMLTAKSTELDRVLGLELGADDYVTKPFSPIELNARIKAILRRTQQPQQILEDKVLQCGPFSISTRTHEVCYRDMPVELTAREFDLLLHFARNPGQVFKRSELLDEVWGYGHDGYEHTVNSHINRLRSKIEENPAEPHHILTVWGVGYKFSPDLTATA